MYGVQFCLMTLPVLVAKYEAFSASAFTSTASPWSLGKEGFRHFSLGVV